MPSTYTTRLRLTKQANGENSNTWGTIFNSQFADLIDVAIGGYASVAMTDADYTLTASNGVADEARNAMVRITGTLTLARNIIVPTASKLYFVHNATTGGFALTVKTTSGTGVVILNGDRRLVACDGTNVVEIVDALPATAKINGLTVGYLGIPQNIEDGVNYTLVASDAGRHIYHSPADSTARVWTIPANSSVAYPIGTAITFIVDQGAGPVTLNINSDTMTLAGSGSTGARTLNSPSVATAVKVASTRWVISGNGVS
jgi:hypothetical protein